MKSTRTSQSDFNYFFKIQTMWLHYRKVNNLTYRLSSIGVDVKSPLKLLLLHSAETKRKNGRFLSWILLKFTLCLSDRQYNMGMLPRSGNHFTRNFEIVRNVLCFLFLSLEVKIKYPQNNCFYIFSHSNHLWCK